MSIKNLNTPLEKSKEYLNKAYQFQMKGQFEEAILNYKLSLDHYPSAEAHTFLGWTYSFLGDLDKAIEECKKAISVDPEYGNPYNDIGSYLIQQGKHDEALTWLDLAINARNYDNHHFAHLNIGRVLEFKGLWFEALDEYKTALGLSPDYLLAKQCINKIQGLLN
ncbi:MAG TPA: tetratricopeptide repeat protein [Ignavibacteria bacterium]|nr:tetratricopeptide repeat protein [Ignavibacteria bacterium]